MKLPKIFTREKVVLVQPPKGDEVLYFSGLVKDFEMADKFIEVIENWEFNTTPLGLECKVCEAIIKTSLLDKALHLVKSHEYRTDGELRNVHA